MKKFLALLALASASAFATPSASVVTSHGPSGATTQTANSTSNGPVLAADGFNVANITACLFEVSAASGQTLSGAGTLRIWFYDTDGTVRWTENGELQISVSVSSVRDMSTYSYPVLVKRGRLYVEARSVTSSSGALTVRSVCW